MRSLIVIIVDINDCNIIFLFISVNILTIDRQINHLFNVSYAKRSNYVGLHWNDFNLAQSLMDHKLDRRLANDEGFQTEPRIESLTVH